MLLLSMVWFSMVNALTFDLDRGPFGTLNLSKLMIKPNANSDSTIELSGHTIRIKTSEGNTGKIRVGLVCNESGTSCKDVQTLLRYGDIEWKQIPISWTLSKVLLPESTWSNVWIWKSTDLGAITEADEKLWVIWKTRLEWDLTVSGGKITVYEICDETGKCKKVSELSTWGDTTITDSEWSVTWVIVFWKAINVLQPKNLGNHVWIWNYDEDSKWDYRLRVTWKTRLDWDLLVSTGNITVYQICDENGNCKKVSELYTWNWGGGWDVYWKKSSDVNPTLITSWYFSSIKLESDLTVDKNGWKVNVYQICDTGGHNCRVVTDISTGWTNYWKINSNKLTASWTFYGLELSSANIWASYSFEIKDWEDLNHPTKTKVLIDNNWLTVTWSTTLNNALTVKWNANLQSWLTVTWATTLNNNLNVTNWNITVDKSDWKVNVYQICNKNGQNCKTVSDISTYWKTASQGHTLTMSNDNYGFQLSTNSNFWQSYTFEVKDGETTKTKVVISNNWLTVQTWNTKINKNLNVSWNTNLHNLHVDATTNLSGALNVSERAQFDNSVSINSGNLSVWGNTILQSDTTISGNVIIRSQGYDGVQITNNQKSWESPFYFRVLSHIRLTPFSLTGNKGWNIYGNDLSNDFSDLKLDHYLPCDPSNEWTILYYREYDGEKRSYWYFKGCVCTLRYSSIASSTPSKYTCHREKMTDKFDRNDNDGGRINIQ